jgi:hypothetical protein
VIDAIIVQTMHARHLRTALLVAGFEPSTPSMLIQRLTVGLGQVDRDFRQLGTISFKSALGSTYELERHNYD